MYDFIFCAPKENSGFLPPVITSRTRSRAYFYALSTPSYRICSFCVNIGKYFKTALGLVGNYCSEEDRGDFSLPQHPPCPSPTPLCVLFYIGARSSPAFGLPIGILSNSFCCLNKKNLRLNKSPRTLY